MRKLGILLGLLLGILVFQGASFAMNYVELTSCPGVLKGDEISNTYFKFVSDVNNTGHCFDIDYWTGKTARNIIIDLNGHTVNTSVFIGMYACDNCKYEYITIMNGTIIANTRFEDRYTSSYYHIYPSHWNLKDLVIEAPEFGTETYINFQHFHFYNVTFRNTTVKYHGYFYGTRMKLYNVSIVPKLSSSQRIGALCYDVMEDSNIEGLLYYPCDSYDHIYKTPKHLDVSTNSKTVFGDSYIHVFYVSGNDIIARAYYKDYSAYVREHTFTDLLYEDRPDLWEVRYFPQVSKIVLISGRYSNVSVVCVMDENYTSPDCHTLNLNFTKLSMGGYYDGKLYFVGVESLVPPKVYVFSYDISATPATLSLSPTLLSFPASYNQLYDKPYVVYNGTHYILFGLFNNDVPGYSGASYLYYHVYDSSFNHVDDECSPPYRCYTELNRVIVYTYPDGEIGLVGINFDRHDFVRATYTMDLRETSKNSMFVPIFYYYIDGIVDYGPVERFNIYLPYFKYVEPEVVAPPQKYSITSCMDIAEPGTYVLQNDLHLTDSLRTSCLHILSDNVQIDLNNHKIVNDLGKDNVRYGIYSAGWLVKQNYLEISNGTIEGFTTGIFVGDYNQVRIQRITTLGNNKGISAGNIDTLYITDSKIYDEVPIGSLPDGKYDIIGIELNQIYGGIISNNEIGYQELDPSIGQIIYHWADVGIYGERVTNVLFKHLKVYGLEVAGYFKDSDSNQFKCNYWYPPFYNTYPSFVLDMDSTDNYGCGNNGNLNIINTQNTFEPQCPPGECAPEYQVCVEGYVCLNETHSAYQYSNCTISNIEFCTYGCNYLTGKCKSYLGEYCGNGICDPNENEYICPQDCGAPYVQPNVTPTPPSPPPTPPQYNLTQPLAGINTTALEESGYGWVTPFLTPAFIAVVAILGVGAAVEYYIRTGGVAFALTVMSLSLILWYLGFFPASVAVLITVLCGLFLWYLFSRMGGG